MITIVCVCATKCFTVNRFAPAPASRRTQGYGNLQVGEIPPNSTITIDIELLRWAWERRIASCVYGSQAELLGCMAGH